MGLDKKYYKRMKFVGAEEPMIKIKLTDNDKNMLETVAAFLDNVIEIEGKE